MRLGLLLRVREVCEQTPFVLSLSKDLYPTKFAKLENRHSGRDCRNPGHRDVNFKCIAAATIILMWVLVPTDETLSFASPKESVQRKGDPDAACFLRFSHLPGVVKRDFHVPLTTRDIPIASLTGYTR
jgi:hypothetical protein